MIIPYMKNETRSGVLVICECGSSEHQLIIKTFDDDEDVYVDVHLVSYSFWKRVKYAFKYIFGYKSKYGAFDEIIINKQEFKQLHKKIK